MNREHKILVVDDDPDFLDFARIVLDKRSYEVVVAPGEKEALAELEAEKPDLLVLDVVMSKWDSGFQFMWKLKTDGRYEDIPILIVTAVDRQTHIDFARHAYPPRTAADEEYLPVHGYLVKPVKADQLLSCVRGILEYEARQKAKK